MHLAEPSTLTATARAIDERQALSNDAIHTHIHTYTTRMHINTYTFYSPKLTSSKSIVIGSLLFMLRLAKFRLRLNAWALRVLWLLCAYSWQCQRFGRPHWHILWANESALKFSNFVFFLFGIQWNFRFSCVDVVANIYVCSYASMHTTTIIKINKFVMKVSALLILLF